MAELLNKFSSPSRYVRRWVKVKSNDYGYGFCTEKRPDGAVVVYTDIPGVAQTQVVVPVEQLEVVRVAKGTRVWLKGEPYGWHAAEIVDASGFGEYHVRVPGISRDVKLAGDRFVVRWSLPLADPAKALASGLCDSPEYYEARRAFRDELLRQRRVSRGFTGVLSAAVELYPHQLDTVARVLADPVLRYLLADEVGLGKTIEAGLVLRQLLLDDPHATALIAVPTPLIRQWQDELRGRLLLGNALSVGRIRLVRHERMADQADVRKHALVVVDEAHRLLPHLRRAPRLYEDMLATRGLLLLSATPMRGNFDEFLQLLNLVDSTAFPRNALADFRARVAARETEATNLEALASLRMTRSMRVSVLAELEEAHRSDPVLAGLARDCRTADAPDAPVWKELINYVRETYRISRRMIRHRRNTEATERYPVAGRQATFITFRDPTRSTVDEFLDQYHELQDDAADAEVFGRTVLNGLCGPKALLRHLQQRLAALPGNPLHVPERERALFRSAVARLELADTGARLDFMLGVVDGLLREGRRVAVVGTPADSAQEFYTAAVARWHNKVSSHFGAMPVDHRETEVARFLSSDGGAVLVGDHTIEEGRNLQDAHVLVNLDLPLDPNRLEQRIGRLDRFARRVEPAVVVVVDEPESSWVAPHVRLLNEGIGIFEASVATLQRKLVEVVEQLKSRLLEKGNLAFEMDLAALRSALETERTEVDLLEEMESVAVASDFDEDGIAELNRAEDDFLKLTDAFTRLTSMQGGLDLRPFENPTTGVVGFDSDPQRMVFGAPEDVADEVLPLLKTSRAYSRRVATDRVGVAPLRLGDPLIDWLERYLRVDERGRARAVIRRDPSVRIATLWLQCDFLVEFDDSHLRAESEAARRRLRRRGDALLAPVLERTWTNGDGPADASTVSMLERPFDQAVDRLLKGGVWKEVLAEIPDWREVCKAAAEAAWEHLRETPSLTTTPRVAATRAAVEVQRRLDVLNARSLRLPSQAERAGARGDLERERDLGRALTLGVERPAVSVVACGAVVLWPSK
ncbi:protein DpdE [Saccharothrix sp. NPDC042600]|uniref:protein DpdE n=1 Tax=Saccharothrix TaxID=2071 RepID=UPI0033F065BE